MKGDNTIDQSGVYGMQGVAAASNKPGARNFSTTWKDAAGNLWLFGGTGYANGVVGYLNDLWKYNTSNNVWTWVKGDNNVSPYSSYGIKSIAGISNKPGGAFASVSWTDASNNLWLFGGFGYTGNDFGFLNSLWKYNSTANEWTWMKGDTTIDEKGVYGLKGIANAANKPGSRYGSQTWVDAAGNLWLYGGYGTDENASGILNDIWKYNPLTNEWTWITGDKLIDQPAVYGTKGISDAANKPGARYVSTSWADTNGNLWLFGGYGMDENNTGTLNDMWKYNPSVNEWTWINGDKIIDQTASYGTTGIPSPSNKPGARYVSSAWTNANGELWLFGGYGFDQHLSGYLNDLWKYNPATNNWTWVKGDSTVDQPGVYGTQGMAASTNKSGARTGSVSWTDVSGNLWLFGGYGLDGNTSGVLNDLWRISNLMIMLPIHLLHFNGSILNNTAQLQWETEQETNFSHFTIQRSFDGINFITIGEKNGAGSATKNQYQYVDRDLKNHAPQKICYRLQLVNKDGSFTFSNIVVFNLKATTGMSIFPNPAVQSINISFEQSRSGKIEISITDMIGAIVKKQTEFIAAGRAGIYTDISLLATGSYLIIIANEKGSLIQQKFIKQ